MVYLPLPGFERVRWENIFVEKGARITWLNDWLSFPYILKTHSGAKNIRNNFFGVSTIFFSKICLIIVNYISKKPHILTNVLICSLILLAFELSLHLKPGLIQLGTFN
jgi:hypothetical protein